MALVPGSRTLLVDGLDTHLVEAGSGPVVLLLHGGAFGECADTAWSGVHGGPGTIERLAQGAHVIAPDWLGFGASAKVRDFADLPGRMLRHLGRLLETLEVPGPVDVVALSMGGSLLLHDLVAATPVLPVRRAVLVSAGGPPIDPATWGRLLDYDGTPASMRRNIALVTAGGDVARGAGDGDPARRSLADDEDYVSRRVEASRQPGAYEFMASLQARPPWAPPRPPGDPVPYHRVDVPTLVVAGTQDPLKPAGYAETVARAVPGAQLHLVQGAGHLPQLEAPEEFARVVSAFLLDTHSPSRLESA